MRTQINTGVTLWITRNNDLGAVESTPQEDNEHHVYREME